MFSRLFSGIARGTTRGKGILGLGRGSTSPTGEAPNKSGVDRWILWAGATAGLVGGYMTTYKQPEKKKASEGDEGINFSGTKVFSDAGMVSMGLNQYNYAIAAIAKDENHNVICAAVAFLKNNSSSEEMTLQELLKDIVDAKSKFENCKSRSNREELIAAIKKFRSTLNELKNLKADDICNAAIKSLNKRADVSKSLIKDLKSRIRDEFKNTKFCVDVMEAELYAIQLALWLAAFKMPKANDEVAIHNDNHNSVHRANFALVRSNNVKNYVDAMNLQKIKLASLPPRKGHPNEQKIVDNMTLVLDETSIKILFEQIPREHNSLSDLLVWYAKSLEDDEVHFFGSEADVAAIHVRFKERITLDKLLAKPTLSQEEQAEVERLKKIFDRISTSGDKFD